MAEIPVTRISALEGHITTGRFGPDGEVGVTLRLMPDLVLHQVAAWPDTLKFVGAKVAEVVAAKSVPGPGLSVDGGAGALLRIEPLKFWIIGPAALALSPEEGSVLDLSHSRTHIRISGPHAADLLNRHLPLDLRSSSFPPGSVASTAFHHVGVTLWRSNAGFDLFMPRGFALSLWEVLLEGSAQFAYEVV